MIMDGFLQLYLLVWKRLVPNFALRIIVRALCRQRLREIDHGSFELNHAVKMKWIEDVCARASIAGSTQTANEQHYEVSTKFILSCIGPYAKYLTCLYPTGHEILEQAEISMLESYCEKVHLTDVMDVLDVGCGWGSLSIYLAQKYPKSRTTGLSNSSTQKSYIDAIAKEKGLNNVETHCGYIITGDVNTFEFVETRRFDRILSIEISTWLRPASANYARESLLFVHMFCGTMSSHNLLAYFRSDLALTQDRNAKSGIKELEEDAVSKGLTEEEGRKAFYRFRVLYMACSEPFAFHGGEEWGIGHYLFKPKIRQQSY
ncbi:S-adenosyl-L-methionine-dependent methyltransferase [Suillus placidus]|uniref:S-adenosyl-L-methionine-dependent methyltransferase n=1 Tax=Suillus placidus TaxID=48579 RepID=A0A9P6ZVZ5_9AGAM|nr:S-adenosyl-L-methionine-dependent methyltransferase [Suillus placidus]